MAGSTTPLLVSGLPTPPLSPTKRRRLLRESEETDGEMSIEQYLYATDPFRATTDKLRSLPHPLQFVESSRRETILEFRTEILETLRSHGFSDEPLICVDKVFKAGYPNGDIGVETLRVVFHGRQQSLGSFSNARDSLQNLLLQNGCQDFEIEIIHRFFCFSPSIFAIDPSHPTTSVYNSAKGNLIRQLRRELSSDWLLLCLFEVGRNDLKASPTLVVLVKPGAVCDWANLGNGLKRTLRGFSHGTSINIEFLPGSIDDFSADAEKPGLSQVESMQTNGKMEIGFSMGLVGERGGGTAGGFVTLTHNDVVRYGILTNHHTVSHSIQENNTQVDANGCSFLLPEATAIETQYFAGKDIDATKVDVDEYIRDMQIELEKFEQWQQQHVMKNGETSSSLQETIEGYTQMIDMYRKKKSVADRMPLSLGRVALSSGKLVLDKRIHDWAFVELSSTTFATIYGPNIMPEVPVNERPSKYGKKLDLNAVARTLTRFGQLKPGEYYLKKGRTTGVTGGKCNGVLACCSWEGRGKIRYDIKGREVQMSDAVTEEHVVVSKKTFQSVHIQSEYSSPGDSGAFLIDASGNVCGLLYGSVTGLCGPEGGRDYYAGAGLAMCMSDVVSSVGLRTTRRDQEGNVIESPAVLGLPV